MSTRILLPLLFLLLLSPAVHASTSLLPRSGQSLCYDASGAVISCTSTGQDGAIQAGKPWPAPRFTDNGNGTVTDNLTGLIWLKNADCFGAKVWTDALVAANTLASGQCSLSDGSSAGQWRLPTVLELKSVMDSSQTHPALPAGHPFVNVAGFYWSSTSYAANTDLGWFVFMSLGSLTSGSKGYGNYVWPVRGGL